MRNRRLHADLLMSGKLNRLRIARLVSAKNAHKQKPPFGINFEHRHVCTCGLSVSSSHGVSTMRKLNCTVSMANFIRRAKFCSVPVKNAFVWTEGHTKKHKSKKILLSRQMLNSISMKERNG